ncbi:MAG: carboxymuconolactone decarboxylase family protein [Idiomarina sp.]|nr:carboxymuconolactone decarboxylase family protein [Idiomarina sp.]
MTKFTVHTINSAPDDSKEVLKNIEKENGFVPNLYGVMSESPQLLKAYLALGELAQATSFNKEEITVVWQSINVENECHYCVPAHTAIAKSMKVDEQLNQAVVDGKKLDDDKLEALRTFTRAVVAQSGQVDKSAVQDFQDAGYKPQQILEVVLLVGQKTLSNYTNYFAQTPVDKQFK